MLPKLLTSWLPVSKKSRRGGARLGVEYLEDRTMLSAGLPPDLVVGRTLSAYTVDRVVGNALDVTYTVYNQTADDLTGVLLTTTLQPGVAFRSSSAAADRSGQDVAWSLGTVPGFGRSSVTLTVALPGPGQLQIDSGAKAFATRNAGLATADTPAAVLVDRVISADLLAATPDANTADPFVQEQAAKLRYDPQAIFNYLNTDVGYESYVGSLRGARGTLWSAAGNSLDEASLGVALFRASGIPARYAHGTLSDPLSKQLILSMFPASFQTVGFIPAGTAVADPANDPKLLGETRDHYWVQFDSTGGGFTNADTSGLPGGAIGTAFTAATGTFTEVADGLRHKVQVKLDAEIYTQLSAAFGLGNGLSPTTVLNQTFNAVDLVGHPLTVGNFVSQSSTGFILTAQTTTYSPYLVVGDDAYDSTHTHTIRGTDFQEVLTNFPLGNQVLTRLNLFVVLSGPDGQPETLERALVDRVGFAARQGFAGTSVSVDPNGPPALTDLDMVTLNVSAARHNPAANAGLARDLQTDNTRVAALGGGNTDPSLAVPILRDMARDLARVVESEFLMRSESNVAQLAGTARVEAYFDRPRVVLAATRLDQGSGALSVALDLRRNTIRVVASPGETQLALLAFNAARGGFDTATERNVVADMGQLNPAAAPPGPVINTFTVFDAADAQGVPLVSLAPATLGQVDGLAISPDAKARITLALQQGKVVLVPARGVTVGGVTTTAWLEADTTTGDTIGVTEDGGHQAILEWGAGLNLLRQLLTPINVLVGLIGGAITGIILDIKFLFCGIGREINVANGQSTENSLEIDAVCRAEKLNDKLDAIAKAGRLGFWGQQAFALAIKGFTLSDPPLPAVLIDPTAADRLIAEDVATQDVSQAATVPTGAVAGTVQAPRVLASGALQASWSSSASNAFRVAGLSGNGLTVRDAGGNVVGTGAVALALTTPVPAAVSGANSYALSGTGTLAVYGPAGALLGVSGDWANYTATVSGNATITLTTAGLTLNGAALPAGTYTLTGAAATLTGRGTSNAPDFSGSVSVTATSATLSLGAAGSGVTLAGVALDLTNGGTLTGFTGTVGMTAGPGATATVALNGTATQAMHLSAGPAPAADQNTPTTFPVNVSTSLAGTYTLTAEAPPGWTVAIDGTGNITARPVPGLPSGTYSIRVVARSAANADLVAQVTVPVTVTATAPGVVLSVDPDAMFTVPTDGGAQSPTAFQASLRNLGPAANTFSLTFGGVPAGFTLLTSGTQVTVPAGRTGILGLYLRPNGGSLPAPGTVISFTVTATSTTNPAITDTKTVTFTMPEVHGVTLTAGPTAVSTTPGGSASTTLTLTAVGNVADSVTLSAAPSAGLTVSGLPTGPITLNPGQSTTITAGLNPAATVPLNATLAATFTATFGPAASPLTQDVRVPVRVVVPGADAIAGASVAAQELGNADLANRLSDLSTAVTNLFQHPGDPVYLGQALAALDALIGLVGADPYTAGLVPNLTADRGQLAGAGTAADVGAAITALGADLDTLNTILADEIAHRFSLALLPNTAVALPGAAAVYDVDIINTGTQPTTYDLTVAGLPGNVSAVFNYASITLQPGGRTTGADRVTLSLTQTGASLLPTGFTVTAVARGATEITGTATGSLTVRSEFVAVASVTTTPPFADPGVSVGVSAKILNAVNTPQVVKVSFTAKNPGGTVVFTSTPVTATLDPQTTLTTVGLGNLDTTGFAAGDYTIDVTVTDAAGTPLPGGTGQTHLLVGSRVTGTLTVTPDVVAAGTATVTNTLAGHAATTFPAPLTVAGALGLGQSATDVALFGTRAYVVGANNISVVDVSNPNSPTVQGTFAGGVLVQGGLNFVEVSGQYLVVGTHVQVNANEFTLLIYDLNTDPLNPTLVGQTSIAYPYIYGMTVQGNTVYLAESFVSFTNGSPHTIIDQGGDFLTVDISNPASPVLGDVLFNTLGAPRGSNRTVNAVAAVTGTVAYGLSSTSAGGNVNTGVGQLLVIDTTNPANLPAPTTLNIPGTLQLDGIAVRGNRAVVLGTTGGYNSPFVINQTDGFTGKVTITILDTTNPANPVILGTLVTANTPHRGNGFTPMADVRDLGNGLFAVSNTDLNGNPVVMVIDPTDPNNILVGSVVVPSAAVGLNVSGGKLYVTGANGLSIYDIGTVLGTPVTVSVRVPTGTGVSVLANSFSEAPTQIIPGAGFDTLAWKRSLGFGTTDVTFTWQSQVTGLQPNTVVPVTVGATLDFVSQGTPGSAALPATTVTVNRVLTLTPAAQTVAPTGTAAFTVNLSNPGAAPVTYSLSVTGVPDGWVDLPTGVTVAAGDTETVTLQLTPDAFAGLADYGFTVNATGSNGALGSASAVLTVAGAAPVPDPQAHGLVVALVPTSAAAGVGGRAVYTLRLTNTGSATETFTLTLTPDLAGVTGTLSQTVVTVPAGAGNFREVMLTLSPSAAVPAGDTGFRVDAASPATAGSVRGVLTVLAGGVRVTLDRSSGSPGDTFMATVTNTGTTTDTFDLAAAGPAALVSALGVSQVTLAPGESQVVPITTTAATFAVQGSLALMATAISHTNAAIRATDQATLQVAPSNGLAASFDPASQTLPTPGGADFVLTVQNTGNAEDAYTATITGTTGPITATLVGLDGVATRTIPTFRLPGLSTGTILVHTTLSGFGQGTVTVTITSLNDPTRTVTATATVISVAPPAPQPLPPTATPVSVATEFGAAVVVTLAGTDPNAPALPLTFRIVAGPAHGTLGVVTGNTVTYTPAAGYSGPDSFQFVTNNGTADSSPATISITVNPAVTTPQPLPPTAAPGSAATDFGTAVVVTLAGSDPNTPALPLTFRIVVGPAHGTLGPVTGNTVTYTPAAGYSGPDSFQFVTNNGTADSAPATVSLTVRAPAPVLVGFREFGVGAGAGFPAVARFFNPDGTERFSKEVFPGLTGGVRVTSADFNGDGIADLVAGTGPGSVTFVVVLDGVTGAPIFSIQPFEDAFVGGVFVAAGDLTGDGVPDLVISPDESGGPRVRVFSGVGFAQLADFYGIDDPGFRGGARPSIGDVNGDGVGDLIISAGFGGGPRVSVIDGRSLAAKAPRALVHDFFIFEESLRNGAYVAAGDLDGDGFAEVIGGGGPGGGPRVYALSGKDLMSLPPDQAGVVANFFGGNDANRGGIRVVARNLDGDARADLVVGDGTGAGSRVTAYLGKDITPTTAPPEVLAFDAYPGFTGGVYVG